MRGKEVWGGPREGGGRECSVKICLVPGNGGREHRKVTTASQWQSLEWDYGVGFGGGGVGANLSCLLLSTTCFSGEFLGNACWSLELGQRDEWGGRLEEKVCVICGRWGQRSRGGRSRWFVVEQGGNWGKGLDLEGTKKGRYAISQLASTHVAYRFPRNPSSHCYGLSWLCFKV